MCQQLTSILGAISCEGRFDARGNLSHAFETRDDNKMEYFIDRLEEVVLRYRAELGNLRS